MATPLQALAQLHLSRHPEEAARVLERLSPDAIVAVLGEASAESAAGVLARFAPSLASACLADWPAGELSAVVALLPASIAATLLRQLDPRVREETLSALPASVRARLRLRPGRHMARLGVQQLVGRLAVPAVLRLPLDVGGRRPGGVAPLTGRPCGCYDGRSRRTPQHGHGEQGEHRQRLSAMIWRRG